MQMLIGKSECFIALSAVKWLEICLARFNIQFNIQFSLCNSLMNGGQTTRITAAVKRAC